MLSFFFSQYRHPRLSDSLSYPNFLSECWRALSTVTSGPPSAKFCTPGSILYLHHWWRTLHKITFIFATSPNTKHKEKNIEGHGIQYPHSIKKVRRHVFRVLHLHPIAPMDTCTVVDIEEGWTLKQKMSKLLCPNVLRFCPNFRYIKTSVSSLAPPAPTPLEGMLGRKDDTRHANDDAVGIKNYVLMYLFKSTSCRLPSNDIETPRYPGQSATMLDPFNYSDDFSTL